MARFPKVHPLLDGIPEMSDRYRRIQNRDGLFGAMYDRIRENWLCHREPGRWPTNKNWVLRVTRYFTSNPGMYIEKQLQKEIAVALEFEGWGNDMPTASGLVNKGSRQMNVDIVHALADGIELFEVKVASDAPYDAALQILRYGAVFRLYRSEPELLRRFPENRVLSAKRVDLKVLAPQSYYDYARNDVNLTQLEKQLDLQVRHFAAREVDQFEMSFEFLAFPVDFDYVPGMNQEAIRAAVRSRRSPFAH